VIAAEGNVYASVVGDLDELFAYAAGTGARRWSTNFAPGGVSDPATVDGRTYVVSRGSLPGKLFSLDAQTGERQEVPCTALWQYTTGVPVRSSPAVANGMVVVCAGDTLYALPDSNTTDPLLPTPRAGDRPPRRCG
jgi:outer membrane protein assembly factor BamB